MGAEVGVGSLTLWGAGWPEMLWNTGPEAVYTQGLECLFFLIDFLQINPWPAERALSAAAVYPEFVIKGLLHSNRWQCTALGGQGCAYSVGKKKTKKKEEEGEQDGRKEEMKDRGRV